MHSRISEAVIRERIGFSAREPAVDFSGGGLLDIFISSVSLNTHLLITRPQLPRPTRLSARTAIRPGVDSPELNSLSWRNYGVQIPKLAQGCLRRSLHTQPGGAPSRRRARHPLERGGGLATHCGVRHARRAGR